jgi:hypothetical protein
MDSPWGPLAPVGPAHSRASKPADDQKPQLRRQASYTCACACACAHSHLAGPRALWGQWGQWGQWGHSARPSTLHTVRVTPAHASAGARRRACEGEVGVIAWRGRTLAAPTTTRGLAGNTRHTHTHTHAHTHTHHTQHTHTHVHTHTHTHTHAHMCTHVHTRAHTCTHTHTHTPLLMCLCPGRWWLGEGDVQQRRQHQAASRQASQRWCGGAECSEPCVITHDVTWPVWPRVPRQPSTPSPRARARADTDTDDHTQRHSDTCTPRPPWEAAPSLVA